TTAGVAFTQGGEFDIGAVAEHRLLQIQLQLVTQIGATEHLRPATTATTAKDVTEDVAEGITEGIAAEAAPTTTATARGKAVMTVLVIDGPLLRVTQHLGGFLGFLEFFFGRSVVRIAIRMVFHRQATIGLLDVGIAGAALQTEDFVVVALG